MSEDTARKMILGCDYPGCKARLTAGSYRAAMTLAYQKRWYWYAGLIVYCPEHRKKRGK